MHEIRNFTLLIALIAACVWAFVVWFILNPETATLLGAQRAITTVLVIGLGAWLFYGMVIEDKLPNHLKQAVGPIYYESDGLSFLPTVRMNGDRAELSIYYQNRYENVVEAIVHLRCPEESFLVREDTRDICFAFRAGGGDFGVIHQPIAVPRHVQGDVVSVQLAANTYYPRSHGTCWRRTPGIDCGTLPADWSGSAFKTGVLEGSREMVLTNPVELHLAMPMGVKEDLPETKPWTQERIVAGEQVGQLAVTS